MGIALDPTLAEAAALCGVRWPGVDEAALSASATRWSSLIPKSEGLIGQVDQAVEHLSGNNSGPGVGAFAASVQKVESSTQSLRDFCGSVPAVAGGFAGAARIVAAAKAAACIELAAFAVFASHARDAGPSAARALTVRASLTRRRVEAIWQQAAIALQAEAAS